MTEQSIAIQVFGADRLAVLKDQIAPGASDAELELFAAVCRRTGLDPFARQIYSIQRKTKDGDRWISRQTIHVGIDGLRLIAARTREYAGQIGPFWCGDDGVWRDVWLADDPPKAARVGVRRKGFPEPIWNVAVWSRSVQTDSYGKPQSLWKTRGAEMLAKTAESGALKRAFPAETSDVQVDDIDEQASQAQRYTEIFGDNEHSAYDLVEHNGQQVDTATGEVLEPGVREISGEDLRTQAWAENRRLIERAMELGVHGRTLNVRSDLGTIEAMNVELRRGIKAAESVLIEAEA